MPPIRVRPSTIAVDLTLPEAQLILRLRQLRKAEAAPVTVTVTVCPLAVVVEGGRVEQMEKMVPVRRVEERSDDQG
jgi:hypothetical protein